MTRPWLVWVPVVAAPLAVALLAVILAANPAPPPGPASACPGFPEKARLIAYDQNLSDLFDAGEVRAQIHEDSCRCGDAMPHGKWEGWAQVYYVCEAGNNFAAGIPNGSEFSRLPAATFVGNKTEIRGPVVWNGVGEPPWEAPLRARRGA